ncbi:MAG TPA: hypothetical protein VFV71_01325 [Burkholderiales bacterium]|nr:hypothetical protein [Burkholderiales bacterium]
MAGRLTRAAAVIACGLLAAQASAQALRDPTRPPGAARGSVRAERPAWALQSVLISPERRYAIINGEVVALGGSVGGAELVAVAPDGVTLRTAQGLKVVHLFPDVSRASSAAQPTGGTSDEGKN